MIQITGSLALFLALVYLIEFGFLSVVRMLYPYELEWIEGAYVDEARRVLEGYFPYGPPTIFFIPTSKTPLFFYLSAGLMKVFGAGFFAPRLLSALATLGCFLLLFAIVRQQSGRNENGSITSMLPGVLAAGIYAASFRFTGAWMDTAKTDSLFLFLILAAFYTRLRSRSKWGQIASGFLFILAYFTKQLTLPVVLALAPVSLLATRGQSWLRWATAGIGGLVAFWGLDAASGGWFSFYTFDTVSTHAWQVDYWLFWRLFLPKMGPALMLAIFYGISVLRMTLPLRGDPPAGAWECLGLGGALILASWSIFIKTWTYDNGFMLASLGTALLAGSGIAVLLNQEQSMPGETVGIQGIPASGKAAALGVIFLQLGLLFYNPAEQIPSAADRTKAENFVRQVAGLPGEVLVFQHGYFNHLAGKTSYLHNAPYGDVVGSSAKPGSDTAWRREAVLDVFNGALAEQHFDWIILDSPESSWLPYYVYVSSLPEDSAGFYPVTGARTRPESLMAKNPVARGGELPLSQELFDAMFVEGWGQTQEEVRWAVEDHASIQVALEKRKYQLEVQAFPACAGGELLVKEMVVGWNDTVLGREVFENCSIQEFSFELIRGRIADDYNELWFDFKVNPAVQQKIRSQSKPPRFAAFHSISFTQQ